MSQTIPLLRPFLGRGPQLYRAKTMFPSSSRLSPGFCRWYVGLFSPSGHDCIQACSFVFFFPVSRGLAPNRIGSHNCGIGLLLFYVSISSHSRGFVQVVCPPLRACPIRWRGWLLARVRCGIPRALLCRNCGLNCGVSRWRVRCRRGLLHTHHLLSHHPFKLFAILTNCYQEAFSLPGFLVVVWSGTLAVHGCSRRRARAQAAVSRDGPVCERCSNWQPATQDDALPTDAWQTGGSPMTHCKQMSAASKYCKSMAWASRFMASVINATSRVRAAVLGSAPPRGAEPSIEVPTRSAT